VHITNTRTTMLACLQKLHVISRRLMTLKKEKVRKKEGIGGMDMIRHLLTCEEKSSA
jgi:hypothetical protein